MAIGLKFYPPPQPRMTPTWDPPSRKNGGKPQDRVADPDRPGAAVQTSLYSYVSVQPSRPRLRGAGGADRTYLLFFPVGIELLEKGEQVVGHLLILQAGIDHLGARDFRLGILDVLAEGCFIPDDSGVLVGRRV